MRGDDMLEAHKSYRFLFKVPGIDASDVFSLRSIDEHTAELQVTWMSGKPLPSIHVSRGDLKLLDSEGRVVDEWIVSWRRAVTLPLNFDYSSDLSRISIILHDIEIDFGTHT
jgi:hypothetical protein